MEKYCFGVDVGGTTIKLGLFTVEGELLEKWEIPTRTENHSEAVLPDVAGAVLGKMKEKGIEDAVYAVMRINDACGQTKFTLDIFGQIDGKQEDWFHKLKNTFPPYIQYKGVIPFRQTTKVLKKYYAVLFPTYYEGEGFAGTLIDAMAAGVPVIASDWKCNGEFVKDGETGCLFAAGNIDDLVEAINSTVANGRDWNQMKVKCIDQAYDFVPENVLKILLNRLRGGG